MSCKSWPPNLFQRWVGKVISLTADVLETERVNNALQDRLGCPVWQQKKMGKSKLVCCHELQALQWVRERLWIEPWENEKAISFDWLRSLSTSITNRFETPTFFSSSRRRTSFFSSFSFSFYNSFTTMHIHDVAHTNIQQAIQMISHLPDDIYTRTSIVMPCSTIGKHVR
jgi:hypothetical protein